MLSMSKKIQVNLLEAFRCLNLKSRRTKLQNRSIMTVPNKKRTQYSFIVRIATKYLFDTIVCGYVPNVHRILSLFHLDGNILIRTYDRPGTDWDLHFDK